MTIIVTFNVNLFVNAILSSSNPTTPAADQIDSDEDSDGTRNPIGVAATCAGAGAAADLRTPPNSFVDPSAFKQAFEKHYKEMQHTFLADHAVDAPAPPADVEGRPPLQEALRAMRAGIPGQQQQQQQTSSSSTNQGRHSML